jgi:hypothetical protein
MGIHNKCVWHTQVQKRTLPVRANARKIYGPYTIPPSPLRCTDR